MIETNTRAEDKEYEKWKENLGKVSEKAKYLLLPIKHKYSSKGLCGTNGTINVGLTINLVTFRRFSLSPH